MRRKRNWNKKVDDAIRELRPSQVTRVYSGLPGCGCGCRGKYFEDSRNITRVVNAMKAMLDDEYVNIKAVDFDFDDSNSFGDCRVAAVETDRRYYWAYLKD